MSKTKIPKRVNQALADDDSRWAFLGLGFTIEDRTEGADKCPYLSEDAVDPKWKKEVIDTGALVVGGERKNVN